MNHRGRFQAQGKKIEESEPWSQNGIFYYQSGIALLEKLEDKLTKKDKQARLLGFKECKRCIENAKKNNGIRVTDMGKPFKKSFPKNYRERVDLEVHKGIAFIDEEIEKNGQDGE